MKRRLLPAIAIALVLSVSARSACAQTTAFNYQGRLMDSGSPANGAFDISFTLYNQATNGSLVAGPQIKTAVDVADGLFSTTLDFGGAPAFDGSPRWLDIQVRPASTGNFMPLIPRQALTAVPLSIYAGSAGAAASVTGPVPAAQLSGTIPSANIAAGSITTAKLGANAVTAAKISPGAVSQLGTPDGNIVDAFQVLNGGDAALQGNLSVDGGKGIVYNRTSPKKMLFIAVAGLAVSNLGVNSSVDGALNWGNLGFTAPPAVFVGDFSGSGSGLQNYAQMLVTAHSVTLTGCSVRILNAGNASGSFSGDFNCLIIGNR